MKRSIYKKLLLFFIIFMFIYGIYFMTKPLIEPEPFISAECPNTMIKDGEKILLYNPKLAKIPGVNPIQLDSLEDYEEYIAWQRANKLNCPILHLEKVFNTQGESMYEIKPSFATDLATGGINHSLPVIRKKSCTLDATLDDPPYNMGQYPAYDKDNQDIGRLNAIDNGLA
uniref:Uncharacterized protein n=1 Tax=viral metagenome TaxID=1070528 RepID=A0A6C0EVA4_9ZZZZ